MGIGGCIGANGVHRQFGFVEFQRTLGSADQHQHAFGTREVDSFQQRAGNRLLGRDAGTVRAFGNGGSHHGFARLAHHGSNVFKVHVDMARHIDDLGNAAHSIFQHVIGMGKSFVLGNFIAQHFKQFFIQDNNEGINIGFQFGQACIGVGHAAPALELERLGDHTHREHTHFTCNPCNHRCSAGSSAAAHTGSDEQHVCAFNGISDVLHRCLSCIAPFVGFAASPQTSAAKLDGFMRGASAQGLCVSVCADELHALHATANHVFDSVATTATHANHLDLRTQVERFFLNHFNAHVDLQFAVAELVSYRFFLERFAREAADPCFAIANAGFHGPTRVGISCLKIPHKPVFDASIRGLDRTVFLGHLESAHAGNAGFFQQAHHRCSTRLRHHVGQGA